jgi:hypothetical protein
MSRIDGLRDLAARWEQRSHAFPSNVSALAAALALKEAIDLVEAARLETRAKVEGEIVALLERRERDLRESVRLGVFWRHLPIFEGSIAAHSDIGAAIERGDHRRGGT